MHPISNVSNTPDYRSHWSQSKPCLVQQSHSNSVGKSYTTSEARWCRRNYSRSDGHNISIMWVTKSRTCRFHQKHLLLPYFWLLSSNTKRQTRFILALSDETAEADRAFSFSFFFLFFRSFGGTHVLILFLPFTSRNSSLELTTQNNVSTCNSPLQETLAWKSLLKAILTCIAFHKSASFWPWRTSARSYWKLDEVQWIY